MMAENHAPEALAPTRIRQKSTTVTSKAHWTPEEDQKLLQFLRSGDRANWTELVPHFQGKTAQQISERWSKVVDPALVKGSWTRQEDETIIEFVAQFGTRNWTKLAELLPGRIGKQCRERWRNHLDPGNSKEPWTPEEDQQLIQLHEQYGNQWVKISACMPGRTDNSIKNRWNSALKKFGGPTPPVEQRPVLTIAIPIEADPQFIIPDELMTLSSPHVLELSPDEFATELFSPSKPGQMDLPPFSVMAVDDTFAF